MNYFPEWIAKIAAIITYSLLFIGLIKWIGSQIPPPLPPPPPAPLQPLSRYTIKEFSGFKRAMQWSPDSRHFILGTAGHKEIKGEIYIYDVLTGAEVFKQQSSTEEVKALAWSPNGNQIAIGTNQGTVHVININIGKSFLNYTVKSGEPVIQLAWSPDGIYLAELCGGQAQLRDPLKGQIKLIIKVSNVEYFAWSPDGKSLGMLVNNSGNHEVQIWDISTNQKRQTLGSGWEVDYLFAWSPDGRRIASPDARGVIHVWDVATGKVLVIQGKSDPAALRNKDITLDWSPDGRYIATEGIEILDANTAEHVRTYMTTEKVTKILWSPDGRYILAAEDTVSYTEDVGILEIWQVGK